MLHYFSPRLYGEHPGAFQSATAFTITLTDVVSPPFLGGDVLFGSHESGGGITAEAARDICGSSRVLAVHLPRGGVVGVTRLTFTCMRVLAGARTRVSLLESIALGVDQAPRSGVV